MRKRAIDRQSLAHAAGYKASVIELPPLLMVAPSSLRLQFRVVAMAFGIAVCFFGQVFEHCFCQVNTRLIG